MIITRWLVPQHAFMSDLSMTYSEKGKMKQSWTKERDEELRGNYFGVTNMEWIKQIKKELSCETEIVEMDGKVALKRIDNEKESCS